MRPDLVQVVTLASHAAVGVQGGSQGPDLFSTNAAFATLHSIEFRREGPMHGGLLAESVSPWIRRLVAEGVVVVRPLLRNLVTGDEDGWGVLTDGDRGVELWQPQWKSRFAGYGDERPHRVVYTGRRMRRWDLPPATTRREARQRLQEALVRATQQLLTEKDMERFAILRKALSVLEGAVPCFGKHPFIWPETADPESGVLASSAFRAAVLVDGYKSKNAVTQALVDEVWTAALIAFEAATPEEGIAQAA